MSRERVSFDDQAFIEYVHVCGRSDIKDSFDRIYALGEHFEQWEGGNS